MKTLILTLEYPPQVGGIASYVENFCLHAQPEDIVVYTLKTPGDKLYDQKHSWTVYRKKPYSAWIWPHWLRMLWQVSRILRQEPVKEILVHHVLPAGYVANYFFRRKKIPYTIFLHGSDLEMVLKNPGKTKKFINICRAAQKIVVNSQFMKEKLLKIVPDLNLVTVIYPCPADIFLQPVDRNELEILRSKLALGGKRVIISVSRMVERKGHALFVSALAKILEKVPNAVWLVIGDGPEKEKVMSFVEKYNLSSVVRFLPDLPTAELPKYYHLADLFLLLTHRDKDGVDEAWGTVFLEAAACGVPTVAGKTGGVEEAVENGVTGLIVDASYLEGTAQIVSDLLMRPEYLKQLGVAGKDRVEREFTWEKQLKKYEAID